MRCVRRSAAGGIQAFVRHSSLISARSAAVRRSFLSPANSRSEPPSPRWAGARPCFAQHLHPFPFVRVIEQIFAPASPFAAVESRDTSRFSTNARSRCNSMFPVPLNSSKITSSIRLPVSIKRGCENRQAASFFDIARRAENALRFHERFRFHSARHDPAAASAANYYSRAPSRVMESSRMTTSFFNSTSTFRPFQHQLSDLDVPINVFVKGRTVNLAIDFAFQDRSLPPVARPPAK